jgi:hypothetical protein
LAILLIGRDLPTMARTRVEPGREAIGAERTLGIAGMNLFIEMLTEHPADQ